jgi:glycosyltransferase involved in cell wall biosynthesis
LDAPLPDLNSDGRYQGARLLAWLHGRPVGEVVLRLGGRPLPAGELAAEVWPLMAGQVAKHCAEDGIPAPGSLPASGLVRPDRCAALTRPASEPAITVVIATRDRTGSLLRCLDSLTRVDYSAFDVVVVDSAPASDATEQTLRQLAFRFPLRYVRASRPGLAVAHNAALGQVTGEVVAITDDDVEVERGWLAALAGAFADPATTCVTGLIMPAELQTEAQLLVEQAGGFSRGFTRRTFTLGMPGAGPLFPFAAGRLGSGANMAFRTRWLVSRGGFDPATGAGSPARGGDDLIAFVKVITDGGTLVYEPAAVVRHWHRRDYAGLRRQAFGYGVGFGAYLTASVCARPALLGPMLSRTVPALRHLLDPDSAKNEGQEPGFPRELVWRERAGILAGPFAYGVSRWRQRRPRTRPRAPGQRPHTLPGAGDQPATLPARASGTTREEGR